MVAQLQAVVTQAIFDHALRMRVKPSFDGNDEANTPAPPTAGEIQGQINVDVDPEDETAAGTRDIEAAQDSAAEAKPTTSETNTLGRINNLVTTDTNTLELANDVLLLSTYAFGQDSRQKLMRTRQPS